MDINRKEQDMQGEVQYRVGSVIEYGPFGGGSRRVIVTWKDENIIILVSAPDDPAYAIVSAEGNPEQAVHRIEALGDFSAAIMRVTPLIDFEEAMS